MITEEKHWRPSQPWYRRFFWLLVTACVSLLLLFIVLLVVFIPQLHSDSAVQAQWLNLTGFPPLPIGVSTVIQPKKSHDESNCVEPPSLWSCSVPQTQLRSSHSSDLPNFRFEIRFRNNTIDNTTALIPANNHTGPASAKSQLQARSAWSNILYTPNPPAPSEEDQLALSASVDKVSEPYNGEETPFYLSLLDPEPIPSLSKRSEGEDEAANPYPYPTPANDSASSASSSSSPTSTKIPKPLLHPNGNPSPPLLYPYASAQPLRLYNRGREDEHYGFYTYYSKSVLVANASSVPNPNSNKTTTSRSVQSLNSTSTLAPASSSSKAQALCTFAQTRFHVKIWTGRFVSGAKGLDSNSTVAAVPAYASSANEMEAPGSFPLRVSVELDRESGPEGDDGKGVFCWALDEGGSVVGEGVGIGGDEGGGLEEREDKDGREGKCGCEWES